MCIVRTLRIIQPRKLVNVLDRVATVWHAKAKVKVKTLQQPFIEVVAFDHAKVVDWFVANREFDSERREK